MWSVIIAAIGLMLIIEGILPFLHPDGWRKVFLMAIQMNNSEIRFIGLTSMVLGLLILYFTL
ncbi:MAG: DUF2065 domain-containing protein [Gammaproteobacteria bacterium]|nr:DUF2065 domain-containing protein [Gammaproteobacteria bacterium]